MQAGTLQGRELVARQRQQGQWERCELLPQLRARGRSGGQPGTRQECRTLGRGRGALPMGVAERDEIGGNAFTQCGVTAKEPAARADLDP